MSKDNGPGVKLPPPIGVAMVIALAELINRQLLPLGLESQFNPLLAGLCWAIGCALAGLAAWGFKQHQTSILPHKPDSKLMTNGIFAFSRNPIYLAFLLFQLMCLFLFGNLWQLILLPLSFLFLRYYVIAKEESYLSQLFGQPYLDYQHRVRRWL